MDEIAEQLPRRMLLCLVADESVAERFPTALRYLQIGLIDEPIDVLLLIPDTCAHLALDGGPTMLVQYHHAQWPFSRWNVRAVVETVRCKAAAKPRESGIVVHGMSAGCARLAAVLAGSLNAELVLSVTTTMEMLDPDVAPYLDQAAVLITPSERIQGFLAKSRFAAKTTEMISIGAVAGATPVAFSNPQRAPVLVYAGSLTQDSGVAHVLRAAKRAISDHPALMIVILGRGPAEAELRRLAASLGIASNVTFAGRLEQWRTALGAADVFCQTGGQVQVSEEPLFAMATGLAIVAPQDSVCNGLRDQETALLFPADDHSQMGDRIRRLLGDHALARSLAATAQSYVRSHNSVARMVGEHARVYQRLGTKSDTLPMPKGR